MTKRNLWRKGFFFHLKGYSLLLSEVKAGVQAGTESETTEQCCFLLLPFLLAEPSSKNQHLSRQCFTDMPTGQSDAGPFTNEVISSQVGTVEDQDHPSLIILVNRL